MQKLRVNDNVIVIAGRSKGKTGKVTAINRKKQTVIVGGVGMVRKAVRPSQENPQADFIDKEAPIHMSNVAVISPKTKKATRVRIEKKNGKNVRIAVACGCELPSKGGK